MATDQVTTDHSGDRDPRRLFTESQRAQIAARQHHLCGYCGSDLGESFHAHHKVGHALGGRTGLDNGIALCPACHAGAVESELPGFVPRQWQSEALPDILPILHAGRFATINAAPGAGKTLFTGWTFLNLAAAGRVKRLVVLVPYRHLCTQWADELPALGIYLDESAAEHRLHHGVVLTYQSLNTSIDQLITDAATTSTLVVLDEVHHLGADSRSGAGAWGHFVEQLVGSTRHPKMPVLNLTGTLFRSRTTERISTVRYEETSDGKIESVADYEISSSTLIKSGVLRGIRLLAFDRSMKVHGVDLAEICPDGGNRMRAVDIDKRTRSRVLPKMIRNDDYIDGMLDQTIVQLASAATALGPRAAVKGLVIADDVAHAKQVHARLAARPEGEFCFLAVGTDPGADRIIERFRKQPGQAILIAVQKVTEGFDVPDVCVLTYLNTWQAPLFIHQMVGRAQRVTDLERETGLRLPATVLIPDEHGLRIAFADVLVGSMRLLEVPPEPCPRCGEMVCACPLWPRSKICWRCAQPWFACICICDVCDQPKPDCTCPRRPWEPRFENLVTIDMDGDLENSAAHFNGTQVNLNIRDLMAAELVDMGQSPLHAEALALASERVRRAQPWVFHQKDEQ